MQYFISDGNGRSLGQVDLWLPLCPRHNHVQYSRLMLAVFSGQDAMLRAGEDLKSTAVARQQTHGEQKRGILRSGKLLH